MKLLRLEPEVPGQIGNNSIITYKDGRIDEIKFLHFVFDGWLGDDLVTTYPCYLVSEKLEHALASSDRTGFVFEHAEISVSRTYKQLYPDRIIPNFKRLMMQGTVLFKDSEYWEWSGHDICRGNKGGLVVTEKAYELMKQFNINHCEITELTQQ